MTDMGQRIENVIDHIGIVFAMGVVRQSVKSHEKGNDGADHKLGKPGCPLTGNCILVHTPYAPEHNMRHASQQHGVPPRFKRGHCTQWNTNP